MMINVIISCHLSIITCLVYWFISFHIMYPLSSSLLYCISIWIIIVFLTFSNVFFYLIRFIVRETCTYHYFFPWSLYITMYFVCTVSYCFHSSMHIVSLCDWPIEWLDGWLLPFLFFPLFPSFLIPFSPVKGYVPSLYHGQLHTMYNVHLSFYLIYYLTT